MDRYCLVRVKVERARKHLRDLEDLARRTRDDSLYIADAGAQANGFSQMPERLVHLVPRIPFEAPAIAGDVVSNLRSALDQLAWQLALANGCEPCRETGFPIAKSLIDYETNKQVKVKGLSNNAVQAIDRLKPYRGGNESLWRIHDLDRINKHRTLFTTGRERLYTADWLPGDGHFYISAANPDFAAFLDLEAENEVDLALEEALTQPQIPGGDAVVPCLHKFVTVVEDILESFIPLLGEMTRAAGA